MRDGIPRATKDLARQIGALRVSKVDWRAMYEHLAKQYAPALLESPRVRRGKKRGTWYLLASDVRLTMSKYECGVFDACRRLALGEKLRCRIKRRASDGALILIPTATIWKGRNPRTLKRRYEEERLRP